MNTRCTGREHGCSNGSEKTHIDCCASLRQKAEHAMDINGADWLVQTKFDGYVYRSLPKR